MAYQRQFYPGKSIPAMNRKKYMNPKVKLKHIRSISKDDVVRIMGHRNPQEGYKSIHPPRRRRQSTTAPSGHSSPPSPEQRQETV